jgi:hypothetical protein
MHINNSSNAIHFDEELRRVDVKTQPEPLPDNSHRISAGQWLRSGQLFPPQMKSFDFGSDDFLFNGFNNMLADLSSEGAPLAGLIESADQMIIAAASQSSNAKTLLLSENKTLLRELLRHCQAELKNGQTNQRGEQLFELNQLLRELGVHLGRHAIEQISVPGASVVPSLHAIGESMNSETARQDVNASAISPEFTDFIKQALTNIEALKEHLDTHPDDRAIIREATGEELSVIAAKASESLQELAKHSADPQVREAFSDLDAGVSVLADRKLSAATGSKFKQIASKTDIYTALSPEDDKEFKQIIRQDLGATIEQWHEHNKDLGDILDRADFPPKMKKRYMALCDSISQDLKALKDGVSVKERLLRAAGTLLAYPLPLAIPLYAGEKQYSSTLIPHFIKNGMLLLGLVNNDTSGKQVFSNHFNNRLFVNTVISAIYTIPTFVKPAQFLSHNMGFNLGVAAVSGIATFAQFNMDKTKEIADKVSDMLFATGNHEFTVNDSAKAELRAFVDTLKQEKETLSSLKENFTGGGGKNLSDTLNSQMSHLLSEMDKLNKDIEGALGESASVAANATNMINADFYPKMGLTAMTAVIAAATIGLMYPDPIGIVDYVVDGALIISEMWKQMSNPNVDLQDAVKTLKDLVGLNLTMTLYLSVNKGIHFLDMGAKGYWAGTAAMTAANLTIPGAVGGAAGNVLGQALGFLQNKWNEHSETPAPAELEEIVVEQPDPPRPAARKVSPDPVETQGVALEEIVIDRPGNPVWPLQPLMREAPVSPALNVELEEIVIDSGPGLR